MVKVKIAAFGTEQLLSRISDYTNNQRDIEVVFFPYTNADETIDLIEKAFMCDVYLFAEPLSYLYAHDKIQSKRLPAIQVAFDEYLILSSFYRAKNHHHLQLNRMSIDILEQSCVDGVLRELDIDQQEIYTYSYAASGTWNLEKIAAHHEQLWSDNKIDYVITSIEQVEKRLMSRNIPVIRMSVPKLNIIRSIEEAKSLATLNQSKSAQIVAGYVRLKDYPALKKMKGEKEASAIREILHQILDNFGDKTYASVLSCHDDEFVLLGTRGMLDHITNHYRDFPLIQEVEQKLTIPVHIGFGLGLTAKQAEGHAKLALEKCEDTEGSSCYIVNDRQDTIGPLGVKKSFSTSKLYQQLIHKARLNNELSYNFIDFINVRNNEPFSSNDIATYYSVTKRSAERTINKLLTGDVIKVVGEEKPYVKGRPRKLFSLNQ
ncbi:hypothetical protein ACFOGI_13235 [Virgibacillus xinjiangensis]|uniref:Transcriptional regulator n=1 Tax=Virgibacillus xinjiangensis TaxID=393090 RepID=A0ABV7CXT9_9BACI